MNRPVFIHDPDTGLEWTGHRSRTTSPAGGAVKPPRSRILLVGFALLLFFPGSHLLGQQFKTRAEEIQQARREKRARLWRETESPIVQRVNALVERGLLEGTATGKGANGWQAVLGGMRSGQGMTVGLGYRRSDLFRDRLGIRITFRGTAQLASLVDFELTFPRLLATDRAFVNFYAVYENSPQVDFYGKGPNSSERDRSSYRLETAISNLNAGVRPFRYLNVGLTTGFASVHIGPGKRDGFPSTDEIFDSSSAPGLREDTHYFSVGGFLFFDFRDSPGGPRSGGLYGARLRQFSDRGLNKFSFRQIDWEAQQYFPYFNKTRVIALRAVATFSFENLGNTVPFYLQPKLGGNNSLRGFDQYRFYDKHALLLTAEHRWHSFSGLDMALFIDAGKVASRKSDVDLTGLEVSAGFGFRFKLKESYFMRIEFAGSRESFRFMWTFSDIFKLKSQGPLQF